MFWAILNYVVMSAVVVISIAHLGPRGVVRAVQFYWCVKLRGKTVWDRNVQKEEYCVVVRTLVDATFLRLRPEIAAWCTENLRHPHGVAPSFTDKRFSMGESRRIWFADPNEAFAFKMRWM